jgi:hypothetical protein
VRCGLVTKGEALNKRANRSLNPILLHNPVHDPLLASLAAAELIDAFLLLLVCVVAFVGAYAAIKVLPAPK